MSNETTEDKESAGIRHILQNLMNLAESSDINELVKCFDKLVVSSKKYEYIESTVKMDSQEFLRINRLVKKVVDESGVEE